MCYYITVKLLAIASGSEYAPSAGINGAARPMLMSKTR